MGKSMREFIILASLIGSAVVFVLTINLPEHLLMFVLFGILPGENTMLTPLQMQQFWFTIVMIILGATVGPRFTDYALNNHPEKQLKAFFTRHQTAR